MILALLPVAIWVAAVVDGPVAMVRVEDLQLHYRFQSIEACIEQTPDVFRDWRDRLLSKGMNLVVKEWRCGSAEPEGDDI